MLSLPTELILHIFSFSDDISLSKVRLTCSFLNSLVDSNDCWKERALKRGLTLDTFDYFENYKELYTKTFGYFLWKKVHAVELFTNDNRTASNNGIGPLSIATKVRVTPEQNYCEFYINQYSTPHVSDIIVGLLPSPDSLEAIRWIISGSPRGDAYGIRGDGYVMVSLEDPFFTGLTFTEGDTIGVLVSYEHKAIAYFLNSKFTGILAKISDFDKKQFNFGALLANRGVTVTVLPVSADKQLLMNAVLGDSLEEVYTHKYSTSSSGSVIFAQ